MTSNIYRICICAIAAIVGISQANLAVAGFVFNGGNVTFNHDEQGDGTYENTETKSLNTGTTGIYSNTESTNTSSTTATGWIMELTSNPYLMTLIPIAGTGIIQDDPHSHYGSNYSVLNMTIDATWQTNGSAGPILFGFNAIPITGILGALGNVQAEVDLTWSDGASTPNDYASVTASYSHENSSATTDEVFYHSLGGLQQFTPNELEDGAIINLTGSIEFRIENTTTTSFLKLEENPNLYRPVWEYQEGYNTLFPRPGAGGDGSDLTELTEDDKVARAGGVEVQPVPLPAAVWLAFPLLVAMGVAGKIRTR